MITVMDTSRDRAGKMKRKLEQHVMPTAWPKDCDARRVLSGMHMCIRLEVLAWVCSTLPPLQHRYSRASIASRATRLVTLCLRLTATLYTVLNFTPRPSQYKSQSFSIPSNMTCTRILTPNTASALPADFWTCTSNRTKKSESHQHAIQHDDSRRCQCHQP